MNGFLVKLKAVRSGAAIASASILLTATSALGGGGLPEFSAEFAAGNLPTDASASHTAAYSSQSGDYASTVAATASAHGGVQDREVSIGGGFEAQVQHVNNGISITTDSTTMVLNKGIDLIGKSRTEVLTKVTVNGQTYTVASEVAIAAARATEFGSSSAASVE